MGGNVKYKEQIKSEFREQPFFGWIFITKGETLTTAELVADLDWCLSQIRFKSVTEQGMATVL